MESFGILNAKYCLLPEASKNPFANYNNLAEIQQGIPEPKVARVCKRTSRLSKAVINIIAEYENDFQYAIFSSRFGEIEFMEKNGAFNLKREEMSPTVFTHSVHNTVSCLHSLVSDKKIPSTALSLSGAIVRNSLFEALSYLSSEDCCDRVLVVIYDGFVSERYKSFCKDINIDYIFSFEVVKNGDLSMRNETITKIMSNNSFDEDLHLINSICNVGEDCGNRK